MGRNVHGIILYVNSVLNIIQLKIVLVFIDMIMYTFLFIFYKMSNAVIKENVFQSMDRIS